MELFKRYHSIANQTVYTLPTGEKVYPAVVDVKKGMQGGGDISYVETDNNVGFIIVSLVEGESKFKIPSTAKVTCNIKRPDGHFLEIDCTKLDESTVQIALGSAGTKVEGVHSFDIKIQYSDDIVIGTPIMSYMVQSGLTLDGAIEEDERLPMLTALIEEVKTIHESTTELAEEVSELSENIGAIVEGAGARLDEEIAEFRSQSEELIANANSAVEEVNNSLEQITTSIEEVNQGIDEVNDAISEVNTALEEVNSNMDRIDSVIIEANQAIESMEDTQNTSIELNEQSEMLISEMQGLIADGLDIEELITARDGEESLSARLDRDLQGVYEYVDNKQVDLSPVESKIDENTKKLNTHERLIDNNLNSIGSLNTRITNNTKTLTSHSTEIANTKQEITTKINTLKTEIGEDIASINDDVARIQEELQKSENTKYSTENGVKAFSCKDGYVDNVYVEGKTLVNLCGNKVTKYYVNTSSFDYGADCNIFISNATITAFNLSKDKAIRIITREKNNINNVISVVLNPTEVKVINIPSTHELWATRGGTLENWNADEEDLYRRSIVILEGDHTDKPISYFQGLASVGQGDNIKIVSYKSDNDNLASNLTFTEGEYVDSVEGGTHSHEEFKYSNEYIEVEGGCTYLFDYINGQFVVYDESKNVIPQNWNDLVDDWIRGDNYQSTFNYTMPKNAKYVRINLPISNLRPYSLIKTKIDKKQILTTLRSLPNGVRDTIEKRGNMYVKVQRCREIILNGSENDIVLERTGTNTLGFVIKGVLTSHKSTWNSILSDKFNVQVVFEKDLEGIQSNAGNATWIHIAIDKTKLATQNLSGFRTWLQSNQITVVYELATPQIIELPNFNPQTFEGDTTLIINSGDVQGECEFEVTNSRGSEIDVLKNNASNMANSISNMANSISDIDNSISNIDYSINRIDNSISSIQKIHYSTVTPSSAEGKDGDLWVIYK